MENTKIIIPEEGKITLSRDYCIRVGKHVIGYWEKERVEGSSHFRPSPYEGCMVYAANLENDAYVKAYSIAELKGEIAYACREGIEVKIEKKP